MAKSAGILLTQRLLAGGRLHSPPMKKLLLGVGAVWAFALLFFVWQWSQNGRYQFKDSGAARILDTRTGAVYHYDQATGRTTQIAGEAENE